MTDIPLVVALRELGDRLSSVDVPKGVIEAIPSLSELLLQLFTTVFVAGAAGGTPDGIMRLEPSNLLLEMLAAVRAGEWPRFVVLIHDATSRARVISLSQTESNPDPESNVAATGGQPDISGQPKPQLGTKATPPGPPAQPLVGRPLPGVNGVPATGHALPTQSVPHAPTQFQK